MRRENCERREVLPEGGVGVAQIPKWRQDEFEWFIASHCVVEFADHDAFPVKDTPQSFRVAPG